MSRMSFCELYRRRSVSYHLSGSFLQRRLTDKSRCSDRIGLDETQFVESAFRRRGPEEALADGHVPQVVEMEEHRLPSRRWTPRQFRIRFELVHT